MKNVISPAGRGSLPVELTHFIGRAQELETLRRLLGMSRLLTLTGAGGSGKSRLALELAPVLAALAPDGVVWVELAPLEDPRLLEAEVLRAFGGPADGAPASTELLAGTIRDRAMGVVLDNCEHLVDGCAALADALLRACPRLRILATSREALGVAGERAWLVPPLTVPATGAALAELETFDAVRLFVDRARDASPLFQLTPRNAAAVAAICARLDGIPLAIELAAARVRHLSPEQIEDRLSDVFSLLTTGARTAMPRHRTLRAALDWSHDLLRDAGRVAFRRLGVFRGGFTLDAAEAVLPASEIAAGDVLDLIALLVDRSMVVVREQHDGTRYQLLEPMRQYAVERLREAGEEHGVRGRFAAYVERLVADREPAFTGTERRQAFQALEPELDNIRETLQWTLAHEPRRHVRLVGMLWWFWYSTHHWVEAHRWIAGALALPEAAQPDRERAALLFAAGALGALRAKIADAQAQLEEAASIAAAIGDERLEAYASNYLGLVYAQQLRPEARECSGRAERWFRAHGEGYGLRLALLLIGLAELAERNFDRARALMEEAVAIARTGRQDRELAVSLQTLAAVYLDERNVPAAEAAIRESLEALRRDPSYLFLCHGIDQLAVATADRAPARAARWMGAADAIRRQIGAVRFGSDDRHVRPVLTRLPQVLGEREYDRAFAEGGALTLDQVMAEVLAPDATDVPAPAAAAVAPAEATTAVAGTASESARFSARPAAATPADLSIRTLGPFEVHVRGAPVEGWPYVKPKELLVFLLCHPAGRTRQEIGTALWPDAAPAQVRNSFHVTLHHLRKILGHADWVVMDAGRYRIAPDIAVWFDAAEFESRARRGLAAERARAVTDLHAALELYRDHFLNGEVAGSWRDEEQDRLRQLHGDAGVRLGEMLEESGDLTGATAAYQRVTAHEPLHEAAHRGLLTCWTRAGHRARAVAHFTRYAAALREQLGLEPEPELVALYEAIRKEPAAGG